MFCTKQPPVNKILTHQAQSNEVSLKYQSRAIIITPPIDYTPKNNHHHQISTQKSIVCNIHKLLSAYQWDLRKNLSKPNWRRWCPLLYSLLVPAPQAALQEVDTSALELGAGKFAAWDISLPAEMKECCSTVASGGLHRR